MKISLLLVLCWLVSQPILARKQGNVIAIDNQLFVACVDSEFDRCLSMQEQSDWCWAACAQMIYRYNGIYLTQSQIVSQVFGYPYNKTANGQTIAQRLNNYYGHSVLCYNIKSVEHLINAIAHKSPLIIGLGEHAYILTHIYFIVDDDENIMPLKVILINPKNISEEVMDWDSFYRRVNTIVEIM